MLIQLHQHPFAGAAPQEFHADSLAQWLLDRYEGGPPVTVQVYAGEPSAETEITGDADAILRADAPRYVVLESPGAQVVANWLVNFVISAVVSAAISYIFAPDPDAAANRTQQSPTNALSDRSNALRLLERVEDIYGTVRAIPSVIMQPYVEYVDHRKVEVGYYCVSRGYCDVDDLRDGDTLVSEITGAAAAVYHPFTSPNGGTPVLQVGDPITDPIQTVARSSAVDGIALRPLNQIQLTAGLDYVFVGPGPGFPVLGVPASSNDTLYQPEASRRPNVAAVAEVGQEITITAVPTVLTREDDSGFMTADAATSTFTSGITGFFTGVVIGSTVTVAGFADPANVGALTVTAVTGEVLTVAETLVDETAAVASFELEVDYSGTRTIASVEPNYVTLAGPAQFRAGGSDTLQADVVVDNGLSEWTGWVTLSATDRDRIRSNVIAPSGMYRDDGAKSTATVAYELQVEQLDGTLTPTGVVETVSGSLSGATSTERAQTLKHATAWTGPARVRARRVTPFNYDWGGAIIDEVKWVDLYAVSPVDRAHFGNKTTLHTVTQATPRATSLRSRELNCLASRLLPVYDGSSFSGAFDADGLLASGTIEATSRIVDILAAVAVDPYIGARDIADLDMAQIWATQQALDAWHAEVGQFNYTFDSDATSFEETVMMIANAAFCAAYRQNGKIRLALDRPQATSVALFTHRNKKPNAETISRRFASDSEYDGVELVYVDPETESQETIRLPLDGSWTKLKKVEVPGIRSYEQAWYRANREYNRLRYQRLTIETETTADARALLPNSRIDIVDNTRFQSYDGEVIGQSGLTLTLSRDVAFLSGQPHSIVLMKRDGSLQSIACTAGSAANQVVLAGAPAEAIVTTPTAEDGIRTIFSFAADIARPAQAWLVQEIGSTDGQYIRIRAINYSDDYYAADDDAVPDKDTVINN